MTFLSCLFAARAFAGRFNRGLTGGAVVATLLLAACGPIGNLGGSGLGTGSNIDAEAIGSGSVTAALLLPLGESGTAGETARAMRNAADMALAEIPNADLQVIPYDTKGTAEGARAAAEAAVASQARLIVGPLFATEVSAAGAVARQAGVPVIAFSTDANVASQGVYLLSFLPQGDIDRIVGYAARNGKRSFAALLPENAYGSVVEAAFQQAVARNSGRVVAIERYQQNQGQMQAAVGRLAAVAGGNSPQVDALLIPDAPGILQALGPMLTASGIDAGRVQILGSGQWNDSSAWGIAGLSGGWFAGPDPSGWQSFSSRFQGRYGSAPSRNATLAYDAVSLAAALGQVENGFTHDSLTNPDGFNGVDGVFRFRADGTNERGLAILEVRDGAARVRDRAPNAFASGT